MVKSQCQSSCQSYDLLRPRHTRQATRRLDRLQQQIAASDVKIIGRFYTKDALSVRTKLGKHL